MSFDQQSQAGIFPDLKELLGLKSAAKHLHFEAHRRTLSLRAGHYRSVYHGRGLDFDEVRPYQAGDEIRTIDWRVTARRGYPHTKLYREERERPNLLFVDLGASMFFGSQRLKSAQAIRAAALSAWAAHLAGDRVGGVISSDQETWLRPPRGQRESLLALLNALQKLQPRKPSAANTDFNRDLQRLSRLTRPGSLVTIISDFQQLNDESSKILHQLSRSNDVVLIRLFDPLEAHAPKQGRFRLGAPGLIFEIDAARDAQLWQGKHAKASENLSQLERQLELPVMDLSSEADVARQLLLALNPAGAHQGVG